jgi:SAM-dependent methyltransferase
VASIDIKPGDSTAFPVMRYDGQTIPFGNDEFDHVFSSCVMEHVRELPQLLAEMRRVLKPDGSAIHIVPSAAWRAWTSIAHYAYIVKFIVTGRHSIPTHAEVPSPGELLRRRGIRGMLGRILIPPPHGENPSASAELIAFSAARWRATFERDGFRVERVVPSGIFYTGYGIFSGMSIATRRQLARLLGSATNIFVLT